MTTFAPTFYPRPDEGFGHLDLDRLFDAYNTIGACGAGNRLEIGFITPELRFAVTRDMESLQHSYRILRGTVLDFDREILGHADPERIAETIVELKRLHDDLNLERGAPFERRDWKLRLIDAARELEPGESTKTDADKLLDLYLLEDARDTVALNHDLEPRNVYDYKTIDFTEPAMLDAIRRRARVTMEQLVITQAHRSLDCLLTGIDDSTTQGVDRNVARDAFSDLACVCSILDLRGLHNLEETPSS